ncbi:ABC1 kinase family protein [Breznakiella homolactica]|uniref:ABC1 atypical kinase-like domain-containing protein n=1 Tax=Breznakiella homolactica TaxID=2798577 RepID=A0A7T7XQX3_9SPIR|nr:AarF/UbiB family protein [Breznakiella homolactica]QQO10860.1 hypothetical protein JFL75_08075 [Breznakiella homolactica]
MGFLKKTIKHSHRISEIVGILITYGMGDILHSLHVADRFRFVRKLLPKRGSRRIDQLTRPEEIRLAVEELGTTFIKFGQMLSNRPDIIPADILVQLEKLQDTVPPFPGKEAVKIIEEDLGKPLKELFLEFDQKPIASASIAQVHRGVLYDGTEVAIKVQRPNIAQNIISDTEILYALAELAEKHSEQYRKFNPTGIVREFEAGIKWELDFTQERTNLERFCGDFKDDSRIHVPKAYAEYSCTRILTMEFVEGVKVSRITDDDLPGYDRKQIAENGADLILKQIFVNGFFHADPHPGNIIILEDGTIAFIDFGMMGSLMPRQRSELSNLILALVLKDTALITDAVLTLTRRPNHPEIREIESCIQDMVDHYLERPLEELNMAEVLQSLIDVIQRFNLKVPTDLTLMAKALMTIEGVGMQLDPEFRIYECLQRFSWKLVESKFTWKRLMSVGMLSLTQAKHILEHAPGDISTIIRKLKQGRVRIEFEHHGLEPLQRTIDTTGNRFIAGVTIGSLIIGSSIMVHADIAPKWHGIPIIGVAGFIISGILALIVIISSFFRHFKDK